MNDQGSVYEAWLKVGEARNALRFERESDGACKALDLLDEANFLLQQVFLGMDEEIDEDGDLPEDLGQQMSPEDLFVMQQQQLAILTRLGEIDPMPGSKDD